MVTQIRRQRKARPPPPGFSGDKTARQEQTCRAVLSPPERAFLEMMRPAQIQAVAFRPVFRDGFEVSVEEKMVVGRQVVHRAGADGEDLFPLPLNIVAVDLEIGNLFQVITVDADAQCLRDDFVGAGEIGMHRLSRLNSSPYPVVVSAFHR